MYFVKYSFDQNTVSPMQKWAIWRQRGGGVNSWCIKCSGLRRPKLVHLGWRALGGLSLQNQNCFVLHARPEVQEWVRERGVRLSLPDFSLLGPAAALGQCVKPSWKQFLVCHKPVTHNTQHSQALRSD